MAKKNREYKDTILNLQVQVQKQNEEIAMLKRMITKLEGKQ